MNEVSLPEVSIKVNEVFDEGKSGVSKGLRLEGKELFGGGRVSEGGQLGLKTRWVGLVTKRPLGGPASTWKLSHTQFLG